MAFGPNSSNPRERRAFAHTMISNLKNGTASYENAFDAVKSADKTRKGAASGFANALGKQALLLVDYECWIENTHSFAGTMFPPLLAEEIARYANSSDDTVVEPDFSWSDYPRITFFETVSRSDVPIPNNDKQPAQVINPAALAHVVIVGIEEF